MLITKNARELICQHVPQFPGLGDVKVVKPVQKLDEVSYGYLNNLAGNQYRTEDICLTWGAFLTWEEVENLIFKAINYEPIIAFGMGSDDRKYGHIFYPFAAGFMEPSAIAGTSREAVKAFSMAFPEYPWLLPDSPDFIGSTLIVMPELKMVSNDLFGIIERYPKKFEHRISLPNREEILMTNEDADKVSKLFVW